jgi:hypothetical protein
MGAGMDLLISKTTFQHCMQCPKDAWLKLHRPDLKGTFTPSEFELHLMEQGNEVESCARNLSYSRSVYAPARSRAGSGACLRVST